MLIEYNVQLPDFPMSADHLEDYVTKCLVLEFLWWCKTWLMSLPGSSIIDYDVQINNGEWVTWTTKVLETLNVAEFDVIFLVIRT